ncbi:MAG: hypothetical protein NC411_07790 [Bacteroides sp.]|nr:hypothetical protein [Bacteroides sp.]
MENKLSVRVHAVIADGKVSRNCIVTYSPTDNNIPPRIVPFTTELHSTTSYNGIMIFAPTGYVLPIELSMPRAIAAPGEFTVLLERIVKTVPVCDGKPHDVIMMPL